MDYQKHYDRLISRSKQRILEGYKERHHILPRCLGGGEESENLVDLTAREHYVAHQLLVKLNPNHQGVVYAAMLMTRLGNGKGNGRIGNRFYEWLKTRFSKEYSKAMKEWCKNNPNPSTREDVKEKRRAAWSGDKNPSFNNPNWKAIEAAAKATRGKKQNDNHRKKNSEAITKWHAENPDRHPMKNPETLAKAVASRRATYLRKKGITP